MNRLQDTIEARILNDRKVFLWGQVDDDSAKHVVERILYLDALKPNSEICLYINSPGGIVTSGFAIYDVMKSVSSPISTICTGLAASMGSIILSAGAKGRRFIFPNAKVMIHQPSGGVHGPSADMEIQIEEIIKTKKLGARILAENCGQSFEKIMEDFDRDYWMDAQESITYGIVDQLIE